MNKKLLEQGKEALDKLPENYLPFVVRWLEHLGDTDSEIEAEDLWLLASGKLKQMADNAEDAKSIDDWQAYLDEL